MCYRRNTACLLRRTRLYFRTRSRLDISMARTKKLTTYKDTLGKRDIVLRMLEQKYTVAEICKMTGASRAELSEHYEDLLQEYSPIEYIPNDEDRLIVQRCTAYGFLPQEIGLRLGVTAHTVRKHFSREVDNAKQEWVDQIATSMTTQAINGNVYAGSFLLKSRAGWKETSVQELTGPDGKPIQTEDVTAGSRDTLKNKLLSLVKGN